MSSTCNDVWISELLIKEFTRGFIDGAMLGAFFVAAVVACLLAYALNEIEPES